MRKSIIEVFSFEIEIRISQFGPTYTSSQFTTVLCRAPVFSEIDNVLILVGPGQRLFVTVALLEVMHYVKIRFVSYRLEKENSAQSRMALSRGKTRDTSVLC